jgi:23S rRNA (adenine2030-N6)-methyltransferase
MNEDPTPYCYIDTHAGRGLYDLQSAEAQKIGEYKSGVDKIWNKKWPQEIRSYKDLLNTLNPNLSSKIYPGSPYIAYAHMRPTDTIELYEIHPQELVALDRHMGTMENVHIYNMDGWEILDDYLPPEQKRGALLVDPSYELKEEYTSMIKHAKQALTLWPEGTYLIWYPILKAGRHVEMLNDFKKSDIKNILQTEIYADNEKGLQGTGMLIINPPEGFDQIVEKISKWLTISIGTSEKTEWFSK